MLVSPKPRRLRRGLIVLGLIALLLSVGHQLAYRLFGWNLHTVEPGRVYRGAQPTPAQVRQLAEDYGVRTIVNLRGNGVPLDWYLREARAAEEFGLDLEDVCFSATRLPSARELRRLVSVLDGAAYPIYLHCRRGSDRTGMAAVTLKLLEPGSTLAEGRAQLGLWYGHVSFSKTRVMDQLFDLYEDWLAQQGRSHDSAAFRHWMMEEYRGGWCSARFEEASRQFSNAGDAQISSSPHVELPVARTGEPLAYKVRVRNTGTKNWRLSASSHAGVHVGYQIWDGEHVIAEGRGGLMDKNVPPGESLAVTLVIAPLSRPGRFRVLVDMIEEQHCWFYQAGSEPHEEELVLAE